MIQTHRCIIIAAIAAVLISAPVAHADPATDQYTLQNAPAVCLFLDQNPTVTGVEQEGVAVLNDSGLSPEQVGEILVRAVVGWCPQHEPELEAFIAKWTQADTKQQHS